MTPEPPKQALDPANLPWRRSPAELAGAIERWAQTVVAPDAAVSDLDAPTGSGMSSETILFTLTGSGVATSYVARLEPDHRAYPVFPAYDLELQQACMQLVAAHTTVPVPRCPWYEPDAGWLGTPFLMMERIDGSAPADIPPYTMTGWLFDMPVEQRAVLQRNVLATMAELHTVRADTVDLSFLDRPEHGTDALGQHLGYQRWYYDWAREGVHYPLIERAFAWLDDRRPTDVGPTVLNWGDARIGNILFRGTQPVAVLDWEMAALGPPEIDVAWVIWMHRFFQDLAERYGGPGLPGFLEPADVAATYAECAGRPVADLEWFTVFAALRHAIITVRTSGRTIAFGQADLPADVDDLVSFRSVLEGMLTSE
jgi:aminoglycoside phosphotransferase (APT) family kinase protein